MTLRLTKTVLFSVFMTACISAKASVVDLVCEYDHTIWVLTDADNVDPPFGLVTEKVISTHPYDIKNITLSVNTETIGNFGTLNHDDVEGVNYRLSGNYISYDLQWTVGEINFKRLSFTLDRVSGLLTMRSDIKMSEARCKQFYSCGDENYATVNTKTYFCSKSQRLF